MEIIRRKFWESEGNWENGKMSSLCSEGIDTQNEFLNPKHVSEAVPKIITNTHTQIHTLLAIHTSCVSCQFGAHKQNSAWKIQKYLRRNFKQLRSALQLLTRPAANAVEKLQLLTAIFKDFQIPFTFQTHTQPHTHAHSHCLALPYVLHLKIEAVPAKGHSLYSTLLSFSLSFFRVQHEIPQTYKQERISKAMRCDATRVCRRV